MRFSGMEKNKTHSYFQRHWIRDSLLYIWERIKRNRYVKIPLWLSPMETLVYPNVMDLNKTIKYKELKTDEGGLKTQTQLKTQGIEIGWWSYVQIQTKHKKDKEQFGFYNTDQELDKILQGSEKKMITKMYNCLLKFKMEEETVEESMITWAKNCGHNIELEQWERIW
uniref:Uncharacterized protein n=1 Tax=Micrurus lemniscatus lemniscatus TaxID=129467 RepID=A0A2D4H6V9_MICLE